MIVIWRDRAKQLLLDGMSINKTAYIIQSDYFPHVKFDTVRDRVRSIRRRDEEFKKIPQLCHTGNNKFSYEFDKVRLYPLGDLHIGAYGFVEKDLKDYIREIERDKYAKVILLGDLIDNTTRSSKGNVYSQRMTPKQQKTKAIELLYHVKDKIIYACSGNHCERTYKETGDDMMENIAMGLGILDKYHPVAGYIKIKTGKQVYNIYATHNLGRTETKLKTIAKSFTGIDLFLGGHIHNPKIIPVTQKEYGGGQKEIMVVIVNSWLMDENYAVAAAYEPASMTKATVELEREQHKVKVIL